MQIHQALGVVENAGVQIAAVHVECGGLTMHGLYHVGVGVTHARHVVVHVEVATAIGIGEPDPLASNDVDGVLVEERCAGA